MVGRPLEESAEVVAVGIQSSTAVATQERNSGELCIIDDEVVPWQLDCRRFPVTTLEEFNLSLSSVRYFAAADLVETLYRGLADNSVAKMIDGLRRADLMIVDELGFAPLDLVGTQLLFRFVAAAYERRSLGIARH